MVKQQQNSRINLLSTTSSLFISISHKDDLIVELIAYTVPLQFQNLLVVKYSNIGLQNG